MLRDILLALDGSDGSARAVGFVRKLVARSAARVTVLVVIEPPTPLPIPALESFAVSTPHPSPEHYAAAEELIRTMITELGSASVHPRIEVGEAADTICRVADELDADVIVMGARGRSGPARWLMGSVSEQVMRHAGRPVTIVH